MISVVSVRRHFPIFSSHHTLVYLDSAATSLKPRCVIDAVSEYYESYSANIFRGVYQLSEQATERYERARETVARFIGANDPSEIVFVRNTTEGINLIVRSLGEKRVGKGDRVVVTVMDHHANFVPWQQLCLARHASFVVADTSCDSSSAVRTTLLRVIDKKTKIAAFPHVSNVLGTVVPVQQIVSDIASSFPSCITVVDGAQSVAHLRVNVSALGCDFFVFSGHKLFGPTGIGVLWGKKHLLDEMLPYQFGGEMITEVAREKTTFKSPPYKFEAGTPHIAGAIGLDAAICFFSSLSSDDVFKAERDVMTYALARLSSLDGIRIFGPQDSDDRRGVVAFSLQGVHPHDLATVLDRRHIAIRAGHHCAMPLHARLGVGASARMSLSLYNGTDDIDALIEGIVAAQRLFR